MACNCKHTNLKEETLQVLQNYGMSAEDVLWVGGNDFTIPLDEFWALSEGIDYDAGFGEQIIASDLVVMCNGAYLTRKTYGGVEWWSFKIIPKKPMEERSVERLSIPDGETGGKTLEEINEASEDDPVDDTEHDQEG